MTARTATKPAAQPRPPARDAVPGAGPRRVPARILIRLLARIWMRPAAVVARMLRARPPSAARLTDRQLADIGLRRADLPDHRGWRR